MTQSQTIVKKFTEIAGQAGVKVMVLTVIDEDGQSTSSAFSEGKSADIDKAIVGAAQAISELAKAKLASQGYTEAN